MVINSPSVSRICVHCRFRALNVSQLHVLRVNSVSRRLIASKSSTDPPSDQSEQPKIRDGLHPVLKAAMNKFSYPKATHTITEIRNKLDGTLEDELVVVHGYLTKPRRQSRNLAFGRLFDFVDSTAIQVVSNWDPKDRDGYESHSTFERVPNFTPAAITGRLGGNEMHLRDIQLLNSVDKSLIYTPETVFPPTQRYLQLRTEEKLRRALRARAEAATVTRNFLGAAGFLEVETPLLFKSTPEGAREFLVPLSRRPGKCYALPQSPQQYKQILMASGVPRYYQFARCFRDEDLRVDRQPEFTQIDLEMSFARGSDVMAVTEQLVIQLFDRVADVQLGEFPTMTYRDAMYGYGMDKPDMRRLGNKICHLEQGGQNYCCFCLRPKDGTNSDTIKALLDRLPSSQTFDYYIVSETTPSSIAFTPEELEGLRNRLLAEPGYLVFLGRRTPLTTGSTIFGAARLKIIKLAEDLKIIDPPPENSFCPYWIIDFPLFSPVEDSSEGQHGRSNFKSTHHPFTAPREKDIPLLQSDPHMALAEHYDLVINGVEVGGGSRRIHDPDLQRYILENVLGIPKGDVEKSFGHLLKVLGSGAPPHAGIALGFDRLMTLLLGLDSVKDVIAFPKNSKGEEPVSGAPGDMRDATWWRGQSVAVP